MFPKLCRNTSDTGHVEFPIDYLKNCKLLPLGGQQFRNVDGCLVEDLKANTPRRYRARSLIDYHSHIAAETNPHTLLGLL